MIRILILFVTLDLSSIVLNKLFITGYIFHGYGHAFRLPL